MGWRDESVLIAPPPPSGPLQPPAKPSWREQSVPLVEPQSRVSWREQSVPLFAQPPKDRSLTEPLDKEDFSFYAQEYGVPVEKVTVPALHGLLSSLESKPPEEHTPRTLRVRELLRRDVRRAWESKQRGEEESSDALHETLGKIDMLPQAAIAVLQKAEEDFTAGKMPRENVAPMTRDSSGNMVQQNYKAGKRIDWQASVNINHARRVLKDKLSDKDTPDDVKELLQSILAENEKTVPAWTDEELGKEAKGGAGGTFAEALVVQHGKRRLGTTGGQVLRNTVGLLPFAGGAGRATNMAMVYKAAKRLEENPNDVGALNTVAEFMVQSIEADTQGMGTTAVDIIKQLPAFGVEFGMTGGVYTFGKEAVKKSLEKLAAKGVKGKIVQSVAAVGTGLALQTAANPQLVAEKLAQQKLKGLEIKVDDRGELMPTIDNEMGLLDALPKAFVGAGIELGTERTGYAIGKVLKFGGGKIIKLVPGGKATAELAKKISEKYLSKAGASVAKRNALLKKGGWNGLLEEIGEERLAEVLNGLADIEDFPDYGSEKWFKQLGSETAAFAVIPAGQTAVRAGEAAFGKVDPNWVLTKLAEGGTVSRKEGKQLGVPAELQNSQEARTEWVRQQAQTAAEMDLERLAQQEEERPLTAEEVKRRDDLTTLASKLQAPEERDAQQQQEPAPAVEDAAEAPPPVEAPKPAEAPPVAPPAPEAPAAPKSNRFGVDVSDIDEPATAPVSDFRRKVEDTMAKTKFAKGSGFTASEFDDENAIANLNREDGLAFPTHFAPTAEEADMIRKIGLRKGKRAVGGMFINEAPDDGILKKGHIYLTAGFNPELLDHELLHGLQKMGIVTQAEIDAMPGKTQSEKREAFVKDALAWKADPRKPNNVFQRVFAFLKGLGNAQQRAVNQRDKKYRELQKRRLPTETKDLQASIRETLAKARETLQKAKGSAKYAKKQARSGQKELTYEQELTEAANDNGIPVADLRDMVEDLYQHSEDYRWNNMVSALRIASGFKSYDEVHDAHNKGADAESIPDDATDIFNEYAEFFGGAENETGGRQQRAWEHLLEGPRDISRQTYIASAVARYATETTPTDVDDTSFTFGANVEGEFAEAPIDPKHATKAQAFVAAAKEQGLKSADELLDAMREDIGEGKARVLEPAVRAAWGENEAAPSTAPDDTTGLARAVVDSLRDVRNVPAIPKSQREAVTDWLNAAQTLLTKDPRAGDKLIGRLKADPKMALTKTEEALLNIVYRQRYNAHVMDQNALMSAAAAQDTVAKAQAEVDVRTSNDALDEVEQLATRAHSEMGRAFRAIQILLKEDMSLEGIIRRWRKAQHGETLDQQQFADAEASAKRIVELEAELRNEEAKNVTNAAGLEAIQNTVDQLVNELKKIKSASRQRANTQRGLFETSNPQVKAKINKWASFYSTEAATAGEEAETGMDPELLAATEDMLRDFMAGGIQSLDQAKEQLAFTINAELTDEQQSDLQTAWDSLKAKGVQPAGKKPKAPTGKQPAFPPGHKLGPMPPDPGPEIGQKTIGPLAERVKAVMGKGAPILPPERYQGEGKGAPILEPQSFLEGKGVAEGAGQGTQGALIEETLTEAEAKRANQLVAQLKRLKELLETGVRAKEKAKAPEPTPRELELRHQINTVKQHIYAQENAIRRQNAPLAVKIGTAILETSEVVRSGWLGFDFGITLAQGGMFAAGHPIQAAKDLFSAIRSFISEKGQFFVEQKIRNSPNANAYDRMGIDFSELAGTRSEQEEFFQGQAITAIPVLSNFARAFTTGMNLIRAHYADAMINSFSTLSSISRKKAELDPAAAELIGNAVNVMGGRGSLWKWAKMAMPAATKFFLAPRWVISRFQIILGQPLLHGFGRKGFLHTNRARAAVAFEYARSITGMLAIHGLWKLAAALWPDDDEENRPTFEYDPRSSDAFQVKMGPTRLDLTAGLRTAAVFMTRMWTGEKKDDETGKIEKAEPVRTAWNFTRSKLAPLPSGVVDWKLGKGMENKPANIPSILAHRTVPLWFTDVYDNLRDQGVTKGTALNVLAMIGGRTSSRSEEDGLIDAALDKIGWKPEAPPEPKKHKKSAPVR